MRQAQVASVALSLAALAAATAHGGCSSYGGTDYPDGGVGGVPSGTGVGGPCAQSSDCRAGLTCQATTCQPCNCSPTGATCVISDECAAGTYCGPAKTCVAGGAGVSGAPCSSDADCASGLRCDLVGLAGECKPEGTGDVGGKCGSSADCFGGLVCTGGACQPLPPGSPPFGISTWQGETCTDPSGATQAYFRVPRGSNDGDFYRLPFPNDVRIDAGKISLAGHPTPGSDLLGFDVVARYLTDIEATVDGFSTYPTIYFRFSAPVDLDGTLKASGAIRFLDITTPSSRATSRSAGWPPRIATRTSATTGWACVRRRVSR